MPSILIRLPVVKKPPSRTKSSASALTIEEALQRRTFNHRLPVLQLCPDLLEYIFLLAAELEADSYDLRRAAIAWSHTCHYWRFVAHSVKTLWAMLIDFDDRSYRWNEEMLRRSYPIPIKLSYRDDLSRSKETFALQLSHLNRIQRYSLACQDTDWNTLVGMLGRPAPSLHSICITCHRSFRAIRPSTPLLPAGLFAGYAPNLRRLAMKGCIMDFSSPLLTSLAHLKVTDLTQSLAPTSAEWLDRLRQMPSLTELILENAILPSRYLTSSAVILSQPGGLAPLPYISKLILQAPIAEVSTLLRHLPMPLVHNWNITCLECVPGPDLDVVVRTFAQGLQAAETDSQCPLLVAANEYSIYLRNGLLIGDRPKGAYLSFTFNTTTSQSWDSVFPFVTAGLSDAMSRVTSLELILPSMHPSLLSLLRRAERLNTLARLTAKMSKVLLPELQKSMSVGLQTFGILLPRLDRIAFTDDQSMWGESYRNFVAFLQWRSQIGAPIRTVQFLRCCVLESVVEELKALGVEVEREMGGFRWQNL